MDSRFEGQCFICGSTKNCQCNDKKEEGVAKRRRTDNDFKGETRRLSCDRVSTCQHVSVRGRCQGRSCCQMMCQWAKYRPCRQVDRVIGAARYHALCIGMHLMHLRLVAHCCSVCFPKPIRRLHCTDSTCAAIVFCALLTGTLHCCCCRCCRGDHRVADRCSNG